MDYTAEPTDRARLSAKRTTVLDSTIVFQIVLGDNRVGEILLLPNAYQVTFSAKFALQWDMVYDKVLRTIKTLPRCLHKTLMKARKYFTLSSTTQVVIPDDTKYPNSME